MKLLLQAALIFALFWVSQTIEAVLPFTFPASVICMLLLLILLLCKVIQLRHIREVGEFLTSHMGFLMVPICASIMNYMDLILEHAVAFFTICAVTTVLTFAATALTVQAVCRWMERRKEAGK